MKTYEIVRVWAGVARHPFSGELEPCAILEGDGKLALIWNRAGDRLQNHLSSWPQVDLSTMLPEPRGLVWRLQRAGIVRREVPLPRFADRIAVVCHVCAGSGLFDYLNCQRGPFYLTRRSCWRCGRGRHHEERGSGTEYLRANTFRNRERRRIELQGEYPIAVRREEREGNSCLVSSNASRRRRAGAGSTSSRTRASRVRPSTDAITHAPSVEAPTASG